LSHVAQPPLPPGPGQAAVGVEKVELEDVMSLQKFVDSSSSTAP